MEPPKGLPWRAGLPEAVGATKQLNGGGCFSVDMDLAEAAAGDVHLSEVLKPFVWRSPLPRWRQGQGILGPFVWRSPVPRW